MKRSLTRTAVVRRLLCYGGVLFAIWLIIGAPSPWYQLAFNATRSLPGVLYVVDKREQPHKGELVAFWPPANRFYRHIWFVKRMVGVAGDLVTCDADNRVFVDGRFVGKAKRASQHGLLLLPPVVGVIPADHFFASTQHPDGFDSRYGDIGFLHVDRIIGRAHRIL